MNHEIPTVAPSILQSYAEVGSSSLIAFRGYTVESFLKAYREAGPVFRTVVNGREEVILAGLEANEVAWRTPDDWSYHDAVAVFREELSALHLTQLDRELHRRKRRLLNKGFKNSTVLSKLPEIASTIRSGLAGLAGKSVEMHETLMHVLTRAQSVSAVDVTLSDEDIAKMVDFEEGFIGALFESRESRELIYSRANYVNKKREVLGQLHEIVKARLTGDVFKGDALDTIIQQKTAASIEPLSEEELIYDAYLLLIAGTGNTSKLLCYLIHALTENPEWLMELRAELSGFDASMLATGMRDFPKLKATLMETERLFPAAPVLPRMPQNDIEFLGRSLAQGTNCLHMVALMHFDETIYEEPFKFKPQRWLENDYPKAAHGTFGGGTHVCLGMNVARLQMPLVIGYLLSEYNFEATAPKVENYAYADAVDSKTVRSTVTLNEI